MKKAARVLGWSILGIVALLICIVVFIEIRGIPSYLVQKVDMKVVITPEKVERGTKIASMLCNSCHMSLNGAALSGRLMLDAPKAFGELHSANITQDKTCGIGNWTDGEIAFLLRTGIKKDGSFNPIMPKFAYLSDNDIESIIAYLRSDRPEVQAVPIKSVVSSYSLLTKFLCLVAFKPADFTKTKIPDPDTTNMVKYGKYLAVDLYACYACHSADFKTNDEINTENSKGFFGGGNTLLTMEGKEIKTGNLTTDATGIGSWDFSKFEKAIRSGIIDGEMALRYPMEPRPQMTDLEVKAIFAYLQTLPKIKNNVPRTVLK